jgi:hypothetical protein
LRKTVLRYRGCLAALPDSSRRVLELRSGIGPGRPRSRARVATMLELPARRVGRLERSGLRRVRAFARDGGGCTGSTGSIGSSDLAYAVLNGSTDGWQGLLTAASRLDDSAGHGGGDGGGEAGSGSDRVAVKGVTATMRPAIQGPGSDGLSLTLPLLVLAGVVLGWLALTRIRW